MNKIIVTDCRGCGSRYWEYEPERGSTGYCRQTEDTRAISVIDGKAPIPDWCPLLESDGENNGNLQAP